MGSQNVISSWRLTTNIRRIGNFRHQKVFVVSIGRKSKFIPEISAMALHRYPSLLIVLMAIIILMVEIDQSSAKRK